jgi:hypothetical protein
MSVEVVLTDDQIPRYVTRETTRNIVKRYGTLKFWAAKRGYPYWVVRQLLDHTKLKGTRKGTKARAVKEALIKEGLWVEPTKKVAG